MPKAKKKKPLYTRSGRLDKRCTASVQNANIARAQLLKYIKQGKSISTGDNEDSQSDVEEDEEVSQEPINDLNEELPLEEAESESTSSESDDCEYIQDIPDEKELVPEPIPEPKKPKVKRVSKKAQKIKELEEQMQLMNSTITKLTTNPPPEPTYHQKRRQRQQAINNKLMEAFNMGFGDNNIY